MWVIMILSSRLNLVLQCSFHTWITVLCLAGIGLPSLERFQEIFIEGQEDAFKEWKLALFNRIANVNVVSALLFSWINSSISFLSPSSSSISLSQPRIDISALKGNNNINHYLPTHRNASMGPCSSIYNHVIHAFIKRFRVVSRRGHHVCPFRHPATFCPGASPLVFPSFSRPLSTPFPLLMDADPTPRLSPNNASNSG